MTPIGDTGGPGRIPTDARREAIAWYARLCSGEATDADRDAWQAWYHAHPDHRQAWRPFETLQATFDRLPGAVASSTLQTARRNRRRVLRSVVVLAGGGTLAAALAGGSWWLAGGGLRVWLADYRTGPGVQRTIALADGSQLTINTRTAVDVSFDGDQRRILLREGEILVQTARAMTGTRDSRPFVVETVHGRILALGTRFTVRSDPGHTVVSVLDEAVEVHAAVPAGPGLRLEAGQQLRFDRTQLGPVQPAQALFADWARGSLVVDGWRLEDVVRELARYRRGHLACDPAIADLRISGAFPITDTDKALAVITRAFPVRTSRLTRFWVTLVPA